MTGAQDGPPAAGSPEDSGLPGPLERVARAFSLAAALFLLFMMLFTSASVVLRYVANWTGENDVDIMVWAFAACIFLALPAVTLRDGHVAVDLIDQIAPPRPIRALRWLGLLLAIAFLAASFFQALPLALEKLEFGENTMSLDINRFWLWLPMLIGIGSATLAGLAVALVWLRRGPPASGGGAPL